MCRGVCTCVHVYLIWSHVCAHISVLMYVVHVLLVHAHVSLSVVAYMCTHVHFMYTSDSMCGRVHPSWASWYNYTFNVISSTILPALVLDLPPSSHFPLGSSTSSSLQQHLPVGVFQDLDLLPKLQILRWTRLHPEQGAERSKFIWSVEQCWARGSGGGNWGAEHQLTQEGEGKSLDNLNWEEGWEDRRKK